MLLPTPARAAASCPTTPSTSTARSSRWARTARFVGQHVYTSRPGRRGADQRLQLPGLGDAREARAGLPGRPADASSSRPARRRTSPSSSCAASSSPACCPRARCSCCAAAPARPARRADRPGLGGLHRLGAHRRACCASTPSVLHGGVRLGVEADSLNCSILGPDVTAGDPEFDLFVKGVVTEMTVKAGQKCTAIRRVIVPRGASSTTWSRRCGARLAKVIVGDPRADERADGRAGQPRASARRCARRSRRCARSAEIVVGDPDHVERRRRRRRARRVPAPPCCCARDRGAAEPHDVEPFGPVGHRARPTTASTRRSSWPRAARAAWSARSSPTTRTSPATVVLGVAPLARPDPGARPRRRRGVHRPRLAAADAGARRPRPRRRRRGAGRHPRRAAPHAAHRDPGLARTC